jgi:hypothetical protein
VYINGVIRYSKKHGKTFDDIAKLARRGLVNKLGGRDIDIPLTYKNTEPLKRYHFKKYEFKKNKP